MLSEKLSSKVRAYYRLPPCETRREIRENAGLSINDVARELGVSHSAVFYWETGRNRPSGEHRIAYSLLLEELEALEDD